RMGNIFLLCFVLVAVSHAAQDDPEIFMTAPEMIRYWGYPAEEHSATTKDGYILGLHRIPHGVSGSNDGCRPVVFMQHGTECDSTNWIINLPSQSAGFVFADAGFDVWLGNVRGNTYSKNHVNMTSKDEKFWEFSWDEMADYDLPAMIEYVLKTTNQKSLYYIGHSQGTLTMFAKLSEDQEFASKINKFFALAPIGQVAHINGSLKEMADRLTDDVQVFYDLFGSTEFLPNGPVTDLIAKWVCGTTEEGEDFCDNLLMQMTGPETSDQFNKSRTEVYMGHSPAGTSTQNVLHFAQMVENANVARFDYGTPKSNYKHYGSNTPPVYDFSTIKADMYLYWSDIDYLADPQDIQEYLIPALNPNYLKLSQFVPGYTHMDFVWGMRATDELYKPIIETIKNALGGSVKC
ncbi:hypothetical protein PFISCL1PPCAC_8840, partial [Pristionchus fissidentatus]